MVFVSVSLAIKLSRRVSSWHELIIQIISTYEKLSFVFTLELCMRDLHFMVHPIDDVFSCTIFEVVFFHT